MRTPNAPVVPRTATANLLLTAVESLGESCRLLPDGRTRQLARHALGEVRACYESEISGIEPKHCAPQFGLAIDQIEVERQRAEDRWDHATAGVLSRLQDCLVELATAIEP